MISIRLVHPVLALLFVFTSAEPLIAQEVRSPNKGGMIKSMGQPQIYKWFGGVSGGAYRRGNKEEAIGYGTLGVYKDVKNPVASLLGLSGEAYAGLRRTELDGGFRAMLVSPLLHLGGGVDYNVEDREADFVLSLMHPVWRGGIFGRGGHLRVDWLPGRGHSFNVGITLPLGQPNMGKTRPARNHVQLSRPHTDPIQYVNTEPTLDEALANVRETAHWINRLTTPFFDQNGRTRKRAVAAFNRRVQEIKAHLASTSPLFPDSRTNEMEIRVYHQELDRAFSIAASDGSLPAGKSTGPGREVAAMAKEVLLEEMILPYNRLLGQNKRVDTVLAFEALARGAFAKRIHTASVITSDQADAVLYVFDTLINIVEENRKFNRKDWGSSELVWLPLQYSLLPEDHDTRAEMDALIERAVGEKFTEGNRIWYVIGEQFQWEVGKMVQQAEDYHVLWIHDIRGVNAAGDPDEVTFRQVLNYIRTLTSRVKDYGTTGKLPTYMIFMDQFYYEGNKSRKWLELLESPMDHELKLRNGFNYMEETIANAQMELRKSVAQSTLLQAEAREYGEKWLKNRIKVHVSITNPADPSFWSRKLVPLLGMHDNVMRDHRKISFFDITEEDPYKGMAIYSGMGIGEHYTGATWEDRGVMAQGPAVLSLKRVARELLLNQGFAEHEIPYPLQPKPKPADYDDIIEMVVASVEHTGWAMEIHNRNGYGPKPVNVFKALLYSLMPAGSILYIPDSLWNSPFWAGLLVGNVLRGGRVFIVNPSLAGAPGQSAMIMSRAQELFVRLIILQDELAEEIAAAGGMLKTGLYDLNVDVKNLPARLKLLRQNLEKYPFLKEMFGFDRSVYDVLDQTDEILADFNVEHVATDAEIRQPKLHLKTHFFVSEEAWRKLAARPEWAGLVRAYIEQRAIHLQNPELYKNVRDLPEALAPITRPMWEGFMNSLIPEERERIIAYLTVGSHNQNYRSILMDGEVAFVAAGRSSLVAVIDFLAIIAGCTWVNSLQELEELIPTYGGFWRRVGRWMKPGL